ncbi:hypothetical protein PT285_02820 [Lactobacillus sp. ESL0791]|uniref:hypothetical protein n=1 Tax=Lactobacillus sp. ESL0791 TaxID=2983234 RepID=UPI0023F8C66D|nr:hypothetical protein [Lactobacillus sp. ESL0791]MDF7638367.1 hypothetical protein [Lactobacillus sp. ESL0791]
MSEIPHNLFRKYNPKTNKLLKYHMKDLKSSYLFLEKEVFPYFFTSIKVKVTKDMQISYSFEYDGFVSTKSKIIAIGLKHTSSDLFVSKTLLNLHSMKKELDGQSIHLLLRQDKTKQLKISKLLIQIKKFQVSSWSASFESYHVCFI